MRSRIGIGHGPSCLPQLGLLSLSWLRIGPCFRPGFLIVTGDPGSRAPGSLHPNPEVDHAATHAPIPAPIASADRGGEPRRAAPGRERDRAGRM